MSLCDDLLRLYPSRVVAVSKEMFTEMANTLAEQRDDEIVKGEMKEQYDVHVGHDPKAHVVSFTVGNDLLNQDLQPVRQFRIFEQGTGKVLLLYMAISEKSKSVLITRVEREDREQ